MCAYPPQFLRAMRDLLGAEYPAFEASLAQPAAQALRLNPRRPGVEALLGPVVGDAVAWEKDGRYVRAGFRPGADPAHLAGGYYMQDASAMAPARVLAARPGERVLDLCAAPGGKSGQIAAALDGAGCLVSNEADPARARALSGNLERLGVPNCAVVSAYPQRLSEKWPDGFDAVLVDAPCSGEGMFRREPEARAQWSPARAAGCAARQREILREAAQLVRPGGRLIYSTCTFGRAENEDNVAWLLRWRPDFSASDFTLPGVGASEGGCLRLWPHSVRGEGHFVAKLVREGALEAARRPAPRPSKEAAAAWARLREAVPGTWPDAFSDWTPELSGDALWLVPSALPDTALLKCLRRGLRLCRVGRGYVEPDHALALAAPVARVERTVEISDPAAYLRGEAVPAEASGWTVVTWKGLALGWGKGSGDLVKNHLPKGLRIR